MPFPGKGSKKLGGGGRQPLTAKQRAVLNGVEPQEQKLVQGSWDPWLGLGVEWGQVLGLQSGGSLEKRVDLNPLESSGIRALMILRIRFS